MEIMINDKASEIKQELFQSLLSRYQIGLQRLMKGNHIIFYCVHLLYYKRHKINFRQFIDSPDWIKKKKEAKNPINDKY